MAPPPPIDPTQAALQTAQAETTRQSQADKANAAIQQQNNQQRNAAAFQRNQITQDNSVRTAQTALTRTALETASAREIAGMKVESGRSTGLTDGSSLAG